MKNNPGYTLIELVVYTAIVSIFLSAAVLFSWDIIFGRVKSQVAQDVQQGARLSLDRMIYEVRKAKAINSVGAILSLTMPDDTTTVFDVSSSVLRINEAGGGATALTADNVQVTLLTFTDRSLGDSKNVKIEMTVEYLNPDNVSDWEKSESFETTVELRGK